MPTEGLPLFAVCEFIRVLLTYRQTPRFEGIFLGMFNRVDFLFFVAGFLEERLDQDDYAYTGCS